MRVNLFIKLFYVAIKYQNIFIDMLLGTFNIYDLNLTGENIFKNHFVYFFHDALYVGRW